MTKFEIQNNIFTQFKSNIIFKVSDLVNLNMNNVFKAYAVSWSGKRYLGLTKYASTASFSLEN